MGVILDYEFKMILFSLSFFEYDYLSYYLHYQREIVCVFFKVLLGGSKLCLIIPFTDWTHNTHSILFEQSYVIWPTLTSCSYWSIDLII